MIPWLQQIFLNSVFHVFSNICSVGTTLHANRHPEVVYWVTFVHFLARLSLLNVVPCMDISSFGWLEDQTQMKFIVVLEKNLDLTGVFSIFSKTSYSMNSRRLKWNTIRSMSLELRDRQYRLS